MKLKTILQLSLAVAVGLSTVSYASNVSDKNNIIIFGDSLSDMGNNTWVTSEGGITGAPITNQPTGSARILWPNILVAYINHTPLDVNDPILYSKLNKLNPNEQDVNYAYASAETGDNYLDDTSSAAYPPYVTSKCTQGPGLHNNVACVPGVLIQMDLYFNSITAQSINPNTKFIIWAGANDVFNNISKIIASTDSNAQLLTRLNQLKEQLSGKSMPEVNDLQLSQPVANIDQAVQKLRNAGVSKDNIYVFNIPDLSKTPAAINMASSMQSGGKLILAAISGISGSYNAALKWSLIKGGKSALLNSDHIYMFNKLFKKIQTNELFQKENGLTDVSDSCYEKTKAQTCEGYVFYNDKHPTFTIEQMISNDFGSLLPSGK